MAEERIQKTGNKTVNGKKNENMRTSLHTRENILLPEHDFSLHPQMTEETLPHKKETVYKPDPESLLPSLARACFGWSEVKQKTEDGLSIFCNSSTSVSIYTLDTNFFGNKVVNYTQPTVTLMHKPADIRHRIT